MSEDTRQVLDELKARMESVKVQLTRLAAIGGDGQEMFRLQQEGLRLGKIYRWLLKN